MDNFVKCVEKRVFPVNNRVTESISSGFSTERGHVIHDLFTTYTNVVQDCFCESRAIIRTFHSG